MVGCSKIAVGAHSPLTNLEKDIKTAAREAGHPEPTVLAVSFDINSEDSVKTPAATSGGAFVYGLDVLIANAGHSSDWAAITETNTTECCKTWLNYHLVIPISI